MRTLPISADATTAPLPAMAGASTVPDEKTPGFSQLLQQWNTAARPAINAESSRSREGARSYGSATDAAAGKDEAALPSNAAAADTANRSSISAGAPGANIMQPNAMVSSSETTQLARNIDDTGARDSVTDPKTGGTKKPAAKPAEANPHTSGQRAVKQSQCPVHSAPAASAGATQTVVPLPTKNQAVPEPGDNPASGAAAPTPTGTFMFQNTAPHASAGTATEESSSQAAQHGAIPLAAGSAPAAADKANPEAVGDVVREVARQAAVHDAEGLTKSAASWPASPSAASLFSSVAEPAPLQPRAKPQAAIASTHAAPNTQAASGPDLRAPSNSAQPTSNAAPLSGGTMVAKAGSAANQSVPLSGDGASSRVNRSTTRQDSTSRGGNSSAPRQTSSTTGAHDSSAALAPATHDQALPQSSALQSTAVHGAELHGTGLQSVGVQNAGGQAAAAPAMATAAASVVPVPPQGNAPAAAPRQLPPNPAPEAAPMVNSGQLHATANGSELKISVQLPELGNVEVRAVTAHDVTTAHLTASHPDALQLLSNGRATLEQALNSRDVLLGSLDSRGQNSQHQHSQNQHSQHQQSQAQGQPGGEQRQPSPSPSAQTSGGAASAAAATSTSVPAESGIANPLPVYSSISVRV